MKKLGLIIFAFLFLGSSAFAQLKIGYVDSDTIMDKLPDAQDAQARLDGLIQEWQEEITRMQNEWQKKYDDYQKSKLIMSDQKRAETEKDLVDLEDDIADYRQDKFGPNGELFKQQTELMQPIQNKVFNVIQEIAEEKDLDYVFDRSGDIIFLYAKEEHDLTQLVIDKLKIEQ